MAIKLNSNFDYRGSNPNFERDVVETFEELKNLSGYPDGHLVYCKETKLHYKYNEELESGETGKFEEFKTGGGTTIVDSVDKLDPDAPSGSLATVSNIKTEEIEVEDKFSVRDIYVEENPDCEPIMELKVKPNRFSGSARVVFAPKGYSADTVLSSGTYFTFMGSNVSMNSNGEYSSATIINDNYGSLSLNEEGVSLVNEFIKSVGGVVLYGQISLSSGKPERPTEEEFTSLENIFGYDNSYTETIETHINDIYFKETTGWRKINDVKIVDSVDKLDHNTPQGSLASVVVNTIGEGSFSELYQPTPDEVNLETFVIDTTNLSSVSGISVNSSFDTSAEIQDFVVYLLSKDFDMHSGVGQVIGLAAGRAMTANAQGQNTFELFDADEEGTITVNEESLVTINNLLSSTEFVYGGVRSMNNSEESLDPSYADVFYKSICGIQKIDLYIKDVEGWRTVEENRLKEQVDDLKVSVENLENKTGLIVNSVDELPEESPIGSLGNVVSKKTKLVSIFDYPISQIEIINSKNFSWPPSQGPYFVIEGENYSGYYSIYFDTSDKILWRGNYQNLRVAEIATFDVDNESNTLQITSINQEELDFINEKAKGSTISRFSESYPERIELIKAFFNQFLAQSQDFDYTTLYVKNEIVWEQYSELVDGSVTIDKLSDDIVSIINRCPITVDSVDDLPLDAPIGTLASVIYPYEKQINIPISSVQVNSRIPNGIHIVLPNSFIKPDGINKPLTVLTYQRSVGNWVSSLGIEFTEDGATIYWNGGGTAEPNHTIAVYDMVSNDFSEFYQSELNNLNNGLLNPDMGGTYGTVKSIVSSENAQYVDQFITTLEAGIGYNSVIYTKNETGWGEYDKANKDKVSALESKVAELEAKIQELLQNQ
jgi:hypothetical protein